MAKKLPGIRQTSITFLGIDPAKEPIPVFPTAHYVMGGIPTNRYAEVVAPFKKGPEEAVPGLYAAGECACVSVHGANRLGGNSLLDILVFGRTAAESMLEYLRKNPPHRLLDAASLQRAEGRLRRWESTQEGGSADEVSSDLKRVMENHCGVFRTAEVMRQGVVALQEIRARMKSVRLRDHSKIFNTARIEALELENLVDISMAVMLGALAREESRGAHSRMDFPQRDDSRWMKHSLYFLEDDKIEWKPVRTRPLSVASFPPKARVY